MVQLWLERLEREQPGPPTQDNVAQRGRKLGVPGVGSERKVREIFPGGSWKSALEETRQAALRLNRPTVSPLPGNRPVEARGWPAPDFEQLVDTDEPWRRCRCAWGCRGWARPGEVLCDEHLLASLGEPPRDDQVGFALLRGRMVLVARDELRRAGREVPEDPVSLTRAYARFLDEDA